MFFTTTILYLSFLSHFLKIIITIQLEKRIGFIRIYWQLDVRSIKALLGIEPTPSKVTSCSVAWTLKNSSQVFKDARKINSKAEHLKMLKKLKTKLSRVFDQIFLHDKIFAKIDSSWIFYSETRIFKTSRYFLAQGWNSSSSFWAFNIKQKISTFFKASFINLISCELNWEKAKVTI